MQISNDFTVGAEPEAVYRTLLDFERVGPCIPGATVGPADAEGAHPAEIAVRLGPMKLTYKGKVRLDDREDAERRATMVADVRETRGQGAARAQMSMTVSSDGAGSRVDSVTDVHLTGRAAQMGGGIVEDVAQRLVMDMAVNLERLLEAEGTAKPAGAPAAEAPETEATEAEVPAPPLPEVAIEPPTPPLVPEPAPVAPERQGSIPPPGFKPETASATPPTPAARPIGGFRLLLRALWYRLRHGRRRSAPDNP